MKIILINCALPSLFLKVVAKLYYTLFQQKFYFTYLISETKKKIFQTILEFIQQTLFVRVYITESRSFAQKLAVCSPELCILLRIGPTFNAGAFGAVLDKVGVKQTSLRTSTALVFLLS